MRRIWISWAMLACVVLAGPGCELFIGPIDKVAPPGTQYKSDYVIGASYRLRQPVYLMRWSPQDVPSSLPLLTLWAWPYRELTFVAEVPAGTMMQLKEVRIITNSEMGDTAYPLVVICDRGLESLGLVDAHRISQSPGGPETTIMLDPRYLELVSLPSTQPNAP